MKNFLLPGLFLALAGFGCGSSTPDTSTARAETVSIGGESDAIATGGEGSTTPTPTYTRSECTLNEVQFPAGAQNLDPAGYARLDQLSDCVRAGEIAQLSVVGVDDPDMSDEDRHKLAERRAMLVADYLMDDGAEEPDVRYENRDNVSGFVLVFPNAQVAAGASNSL